MDSRTPNAGGRSKIQIAAELAAETARLSELSQRLQQLTGTGPRGEASPRPAGETAASGEVPYMRYRPADE
jgi:hypothetical protein